MTEINPNTVAEVLRYLRESEGGLADLTARLARAESPSRNPAALRAVLDLLAEELARSGMAVRRQGPEAGEMLYAHPLGHAGGKPTQLLIGHCDTVWPVGTLQQMPVRREGEALLGPGVFDMKGGLAQMIFALRALHDLGLEPPVVPLAVINSDEEVGSPASTPLIERLAREACRAFILEPAFGSEGKLKTARKTVGRFTVSIKGRAAHAGVNPQEGASAILELSHQIQRLFGMNDPARGITVNVGTVDGGIRPNVVAPEVQAVLDVRVPTQEDTEQVKAALRGLRPVTPGCTIEVEGDFGRPPMEANPRNQALWRLARRLGGQLGLDLQEAHVGGASDGNTTSLYTATLDGLGAVGEGAHALHEQVVIPKMAERTALLVLLLLAPPPEGGNR
jgi:glutamate carboxypeptidase